MNIFITFPPVIWRKFTAVTGAQDGLREWRGTEPRLQVHVASKRTPVLTTPDPELRLPSPEPAQATVPRRPVGASGTRSAPPLQWHLGGPPGSRVLPKRRTCPRPSSLDGAAALWGHAVWGRRCGSGLRATCQLVRSQSGRTFQSRVLTSGSAQPAPGLLSKASHKRPLRSLTNT